MVERIDSLLSLLKFLFALMGAWLSYLLGGWDTSLKVLVLFVVCDYITGVAAAWYKKEINSTTGFFGIAKKVFLFIPIALAYWLDQVLGQDILRNLAIWFYLANEGLSVLENLGRMGIFVPPIMLEALQKLKDKSHPQKQPPA